MKPFKINPLVLAIAVALPTTALAQENDAGGIEEIVVTGSFRDSLANALNLKRNSAGAVDAIVAEDIADFPDLNLAESLQRIPGVAIERVAGEGRQISVRGLGSGFTRTRINGMEAIATGGSTDAAGGANRSRGFDFNTFSSELFNSLTVRKTASADVEEGSLGATVDMDTAKPFDYDGFTFAASGQLGYNDLSEKTDPKASFLISNTFAEDTVGALLSVSYSERNIRDEGASTVRWDQANPIGTIDGQPLRIENPDDPTGMWIANPDYPSDVNDAFRPRLPRYDSYTHEMERLGVSGSLQFRPTDATEISLDGLYAKYEATRNEVFMQGILNSGGVQNNQFTDEEKTKLNPNWGKCVGITCRMGLTDYTIDSTGTMTSAAFNNATVRSENRYDELSTEFTQITLSAKHDITDSFRINGMVGSVVSEFDNPIQTTIVAEKSGLDFGYDYSGSNRENPALVFDSEVSNLDGWSTNSVRLRPLSAKNTYDAAQLNLEYDLNDSLTLKGGINYKDFEFETTGARRESENGAGVDLNGRMMGYNSGLGTNDPWAVPNFGAIVADYDIYSNTGVFETFLREAEDYSVNEESIGAYVQLAFDTTIGETSVRGDVGIRQVETDIEANAWSSAGTPVTGSHSYSDTLPSINLVFEPIEDVLIRMGYSEVMARAGLGSLLPNTNISVSGGSRSVSSGNPALEPTRAAAYDLGLELYMSDESVLGVAVFYKDIESFVQTISETRPFTTTGFPTQLAVDACSSGPGYGSECNESIDWNVSSPVNAPGGDLYGFELSYQTPFTFLPGFLSNFGFMGNFTYVEAEQDYLNEEGQVVATRSLLGLSQDTTSGTIYYEDDAFSARVSVVNRAGYLTHATGRNNNDREGTNSTTNIDMSASYQLNDNIKLTFEALNLTDQADDQWVDASGNRLSYYHETGRQYYLGVQYKY